MREMQFVKRIRDGLGLTSYGLGKWVDVPAASIDHAIARGVAIPLKTLAALRYVSGESWSQIGKLIDEEYLTGDIKEFLEKRRPAKAKKV